MLRDSIDYKGTAVGKLFRRFLFPTADYRDGFG